jgi:hypothetical protein
MSDTSILWKKGLKYKICISAIKEIHWRNDSKWILLHRIICREDSIKQWVVVFYKEMHENIPKGYQQKDKQCNGQKNKQWSIKFKKCVVKH